MEMQMTGHAGSARWFYNAWMDGSMDGWHNLNQLRGPAKTCKAQLNRSCHHNNPKGFTLFVAVWHFFF